MIHKDQKNNYAHSPAHDPPKENWKNLNFPPKTFQNPNYHYHQCIKKIKKNKTNKETNLHIPPSHHVANRPNPLYVSAWSFIGFRL